MDRKTYKSLMKTTINVEKLEHNNTVINSRGHVNHEHHGVPHCDFSVTRRVARFARCHVFNIFREMSVFHYFYKGPIGNLLQIGRL